MTERQSDKDFRSCGVCGITNIPRGIDWPYWQHGRCVHAGCLSAAEPVPECGTLSGATPRTPLPRFTIKDNGEPLERKDGEWCDAEDVRQLERELAAAKRGVVVPPGWKLVPEQWTSEMAHAGYEVHKNAEIQCAECGDIYNAMLAAAPQPIAAPQEVSSRKQIPAGELSAGQRLPAGAAPLTREEIEAWRKWFNAADMWNGGGKLCDMALRYLDSKEKRDG